MLMSINYLLVTITTFRYIFIYYYFCSTAPRLLGRCTAFRGCSVLVRIASNHNRVSVTATFTCSWCAEHSLVYLLHHVVDEFIYILVKLCGCLKVWHLVLISEAFGIFIRHCSLLLQIDLVPYESLHNAGVRMLIDAFKPVFDVIEWGRIGHIESHDDSICLLVEGVGNCSESLLTGGIPYFDCNVLSLGRVVLGRHVVKTDGRHVALTELLVLVHL